MRAVLSFGARKHRHLLIVMGVTVIALIALVAAPIHGKVAPNVVPETPATPQMIVAARAIPIGTIIAPADMRSKSVTGAIPQGAMLSSDGAIGRIAEKSFSAGDVLTESDLRDTASVGIAAHVTAGQRAFSIRVAEDEIVGGFLQSADHVDVLATIPGSVFPAKDAADHPDRSQTVLLLQDIQVLAVGESLATKGSVQSGAQTVSLSLTPVQLARLTLALRFGKISLAILNPGDTALSPTAPVTLADLVPDQAAPVPAKAAASPTPGRKHITGIPFLAGTHSGFVRGSDTP